ncbi:MAG TPA: cupredoxin family copper-binding protein [Sporichthyaceae bacterium]|jgi:plastocyanin|nr:cupredoxin family copper-binding protein [Sporichthyaceae bacterium]
MVRNIRRFGRTGAGLAVLGLALAGCGAVAQAQSQPPAATQQQSAMNMPAMDTAPADAAAPAASGSTVTIAKYMFGPDTLTVPVGTTVTWTNQDGDPHTVVAKDGSFRSAALTKGATFQHKFDKAGSYQYLCSIHPFMLATVVVTP